MIEQDKHRVILKSREPSQMTVAGKRLNQIAQDHIITSALETATLFAEDRRKLQSFRSVLLDAGAWIVSSRTDLSTYAYQGWAMGLGFEEIFRLHEGILAPDLTIFIDISVDTMIQRLGNREGVKEIYEQESFLRKCHEGYVRAIDFLQTKGRNIQVVDGEGGIEEVSRRIGRA